MFFSRHCCEMKYPFSFMYSHTIPFPGFVSQKPMSSPFHSGTSLRPTLETATPSNSSFPKRTMPTLSPAMLRGFLSAKTGSSTGRKPLSGIFFARFSQTSRFSSTLQNSLRSGPLLTAASPQKHVSAMFQNSSFFGVFSRIFSHSVFKSLSRSVCTRRQL